MLPWLARDLFLTGLGCAVYSTKHPCASSHCYVVKQFQVPSVHSIIYHSSPSSSMGICTIPLSGGKYHAIIFEFHILAKEVPS